MHEWHLQSEFRFENWCEYSLVGLFCRNFKKNWKVAADGFATKKLIGPKIMKPAKICIKIQTPQWHENLRKITQNLDPSSKLD